MASVKIASLFLKTLAKPISQKLKQQAREHEGFREATIGMAQVRCVTASWDSEGLRELTNWFVMMAQFLHRAEINVSASALVTPTSRPEMSSPRLSFSDADQAPRRDSPPQAYPSTQRRQGHRRWRQLHL